MINLRLHRLTKITQITLGIFIMAGCGYTTRSMISNKYRTIYIPAFVNKIDITRDGDVQSKYRLYRPFIETDVTKEVNNKFIWDGNLKPVASENADLTLKGEIIEFRKEPIKYTDSDEVEEYRVNIIVNLTLINNRDKSIVWQVNSFSGETTYFTSFAPSNVTRKSEAQAISDCITDLARRIVERTVEEW